MVVARAAGLLTAAMSTDGLMAAAAVVTPKDELAGVWLLYGGRHTELVQRAREHKNRIVAHVGRRERCLRTTCGK